MDFSTFLCSLKQSATAGSHPTSREEDSFELCSGFISINFHAYPNVQVYICKACNKLVILPHKEEKVGPVGCLPVVADCFKHTTFSHRVALSKEHLKLFIDFYW